ncbi:type IV secretion protein Rhs [Pseudomonas aeruginosa]|uniref:type VI secretion system Vgr family protein n=1 Tax=Pseudomonas aeruginosa TaxID=287 RepID=UPI0009ACB417|nr:type VI secretion system tip protein VgrG [Pseudomonas aeruginosa]MCO3916007.1 type VI secretion system tip protein VgrG [Pseudomonas aeruginosa]OPD88644.1 type IV secretion protein Rhs [Pseudomonas aeruginosa]HCE6774634.1 type VI secretion system tip protein VgrG [Pseudomonas aeruginosa]HCW0573907.1 type VI secretion system tip protein VgrG [Pseudomonas aeruginosa]HCW1032187.1 type VI secretion system tip protein VgrG [Pseudomonas aeruginosa]
MSHQSQMHFTFSVVGGEDFDVIEFHLTEALSETFLLELDLASHNPAIGFDQIVDKAARFIIWNGEQPVRYVHGRISSFFQGETGFRRTRYRALVEPALARLGLCSDWRIFQQQSAPEILQALLKEHGISHYEQWLTEEHLRREYCVQAGETDLDFTLRLAAEEGLFHRFAHSEEGCALIHGDRLYIHGEVKGGPVRYNPMPGGDQLEPGLRRFTYGEHVRTARQTQRDYTFKHPRYQQEHSQLGEGIRHQNLDYERYDYPGRYKQDAAGRPFTRDRLRGLRRDAQLAVVEGDDPRLIPGVAFDLIGHPRDEWNHGWRPVWMEHHGKQYTSQAEESADAQFGTHYSYTAHIVPDRIEWRPEPRPRPAVPGPQEATVVGPEGEEFHVDEHGRVKVQFPWDREGQNNDRSSCWLRPASSLAGLRWGHITLPRVGQEVIVDFLNGDMDQPFIASRMYRVTNPPPYELPKFQTLSTLKTKEHKGHRASELRLDDTTKEISAALMNDHGASHLHLGYLTHPRPGGGEPRGEGFELRTDLHGALRAAQGLLLTTEAQVDAEGGQLDRAEVVAVLEAALHLARSLGNYAEEHQGIAHDHQPRQDLTESVRDLGHGANNQANGMGEGAEPVMALSAPAGIAAGTPRSIAFGAGEHLDAAAQRNLQLTAGERVVVNAGNGLGTFTQRGDMRHIAHTGQLLLQAQHNTIQIEADKSVEVRANNNHVTVSAEDHITLLCGGAYIKMAGGDIEMGMPGTFTVKATDHNFKGPGTMVPTLGQFSGLPGPFQEYFVLRDAGTNAVLPNHAYEIVRASGDIMRGSTDEQGRTQVVTSDEREPLDVSAIPDPDDLLHLNASYWDSAGDYSLDFLRNPTKEEG